MAGLFEDPYKYVLDTSSLIELKNKYRPATFKRLWAQFNELCSKRIIISVREAKREIEKGSDMLVDWVAEYESIFLTPATAEEATLIGQLQERYPHWVDATGDRPFADPFVIACAKVNSLIIITDEGPNKDLSRAAKDLGLQCIRLLDLFEREGWEF